MGDSIPHQEDLNLQEIEGPGEKGGREGRQGGASHLGKGQCCVDSSQESRASLDTLRGRGTISWVPHHPGAR